MKSSIMNKTILAVAVLAMAAFAGVMVVGEDTDVAAEGETGAPTAGAGDYTVTYAYEGSTIVKKMNSDNTFQFALPESLGLTAPEGYEFDGRWVDVKSKAIYDANTPEGGDAPTYSFSGDVTVEPKMKVESGAAITILSYGEISQKYIATGADQDKAAIEKFIKAAGFSVEFGEDTFEVSADGYRFMGFDKVGTDNSEEIKTVAELKGDYGKETSFMLVMNPIYEVSFVVEGTTISTIDSDRVILNGAVTTVPGAPTKANYTFAGWYDAAGVVVIKFSADAEEKYQYATADFKFTADTTLYAKFVPVNMTVTFMVGEFSSTQTVLYGEKAMEPALPDGYEAWVDEEGVAFDFNQPIVANCTVFAKEAAPVEPATVYNVTFKIADKAPVTQKSDSVVVPNTDREGYAFQGWVVEGGSSDFVTLDEAYFKALTADVTLVAVYKEVAPPAPAEPKFYETSAGQCAIVLAVFLLGFIGYMIHVGKIEVPKFKVSRVGKEEAPVVKTEEEPKP